MGQVLFHAQLGIAEVALLKRDGVVERFCHLSQLLKQVNEVYSILHAKVLLVRFIVEVDFLSLLHYHRLVVEIIHIFLVVAFELTVDGLVEVRQLRSVHLLGIVLEQSGHNFLVESLVPFVAVVGEFHILFLRIVLRTFHFHAVRKSDGTCGEFVCTAESLAEESERAGEIEALFVELGHLVEVEFAFEQARLVLILAYALLVGFLLLYDADAVDALVHPHGVLPVVGALGEL